MNFFKKNPPAWSNKEMLIELKKFNKIFEDRPIKNNKGGMSFPHMFAFYFILKKIKPKFIVERGVFKGQSTWLIEKVLPKSNLLSIDPNLENRVYTSKKAKYSKIDFKYQDFSKIPKNTLVFFDDHQNHMDRLRQAKWFGIKHIVLEDNYPVSYGDFYTLKHAFNKNGYNHYLSFKNLLKTTFLFITMIIKKKIDNGNLIKLDKIISRLRDYPANNHDFDSAKKNINIYFEFPPIVKNKKWIKNKGNLYETEKPIIKDNSLINNVEENELQDFNFLTYIKLR